MCCRTGFRSAKGQLVASLLKGKEGLITFVADALWIILFMLVLTTLIYCFIAYQLAVKGATASQLVMRYLDAVTTAVPPLLTASLTVATAVSIDRLKLLDVFVTDTTRVNYAGMVNAVCFDKTGTLTQNRLHFVGASIVDSTVSSSSGEGRVELKEYTHSDLSNPLHQTHNQRSVSEADTLQQLPQVVLELMATCHSLSLAGNLIQQVNCCKFCFNRFMDDHVYLIA